MVDKSQLDEAKRLGYEVGKRAGGKPEHCHYRGASLQGLRDAWLSGFNEDRAQRKARATR